jgi:hypothetical protein
MPLREAKDDAGAEQEVVLDVGGGIGQLGAEPTRLNEPYGEMMGYREVGAATHLQGQRRCGCLRSLARREDAVHAVRFAHEDFAKKMDPLLGMSVARKR